jgi:serine/threonine-protein kinase
MAQDGPLALGELFLGKYEIVALIGRGGHACVYHAVNSFMGRHVAIKVLHRPGGIDREALRRGQAEAQILSRLRHPNIVEVSDAGMTEQGLLYIVMELLSGHSLREVLNQHGALAVDEVLELAAELADGLHAAHSTGAIHRDLKPENLFVTTGEGVKILDFGIAKVADAAAWTTDRDLAHGTPLYMSPEQLQLAKLTPRSDIYALGVVMYEALAGQHPVPMLIDSPRPSVWEISRAVLAREPPMLDELDARIPRSVATLVNRAMAKQPEQRFESMAELATALRECRETWLAYARVHGLPLTTRHLTGNVTAAAPARSSVPVPAASAQKLATTSTAAPVTTRATAFGGEIPGARRVGIRQVLLAGCLVGAVLGAAGGLLRLSRSAELRVHGTEAPNVTPTPPLAKAAPAELAPTPTPPSTLADRPVPPTVSEATQPPPIARPTPTATPARAKASTHASKTAGSTAEATAAASVTATKAPSTSKDHVETRLQRLERALDADDSTPRKARSP